MDRRAETITSLDVSIQQDLFPDLFATRQSGLRMLEQFRPRMGRRYASGRNVDAGPGNHRAVSGLSPYIRRRLLTEQELVSAALETHGAEEAEKFIQEVFWRGYFKGWLEHHPSVWAQYRTGLAGDLRRLEADERLLERVSAAESGTTGLACFDTWAQELAETGYLHNHARMWFASIWIFTLKLPWRIGADFFLCHLLDGDPAANTLSWRWVAGLHTNGKAYEAKAWNIEKFTKGRFRPDASELSSNVTPLSETELGGSPARLPLRQASAPRPGLPTALLITEEDCRLEEFDLARLDIRSCATLAGSALRSDRAVSDAVAEFERAALTDAANRLGRPSSALQAPHAANLAEWANAAGVRQIVTPYVSEGPLRDWLRPQLDGLAAQGISFCELCRNWDLAIWPHATAGFFRVKKRIPAILSVAGVS